MISRHRVSAQAWESTAAASMTCAESPESVRMLVRAFARSHNFCRQENPRIQSPGYQICRQVPDSRACVSRVTES